MIITIGRQHGSSGREIARLLSEKLNIKCYDKEIVDEAANHSDFSRDLIEAFDEPPLPALQVVSAQLENMRNIAEKGDCLFVGRCADYILRDFKDLVSVFILGDMDERLKCLERRQGLDMVEARKKIKEVDKDRSCFYRYYSDQTWGDAKNYDLCINSSKLGVEGTVQVILDYIKARGIK